jgi:hypothetical protein
MSSLKKNNQKQAIRLSHPGRWKFGGWLCSHYGAAGRDWLPLCVTANTFDGNTYVRESTARPRESTARRERVLQHLYESWAGLLNLT